MSSPVVGTWSLNSFYRLDAAGERFDYGELRGLLTYAADGWMQVLICEQRSNLAGRALTKDEKEAIFDTMTAYAGTYTVYRRHGRSPREAILEPNLGRGRSSSAL